MWLRFQAIIKTEAYTMDRIYITKLFKYMYIYDDLQIKNLASKHNKISQLMILDFSLCRTIEEFRSTKF